MDWQVAVQPQPPKAQTLGPTQAGFVSSTRRVGSGMGTAGVGAAILGGLQEKELGRVQAYSAAP